MIPQAQPDPPIKHPRSHTLNPVQHDLVESAQALFIQGMPLAHIQALVGAAISELREADAHRRAKQESTQN